MNNRNFNFFYGWGFMIIYLLVYLFSPEKFLIPSLLFIGIIVIVQILLSIKNDLQNKK